MKAAEYAQRINDAVVVGEDALRVAIIELLRDFSGEQADKLRAGRPTDERCRSLAKEADLKWRAIANRVPSGVLNPNGYRDLLISRAPELAKLFERHQARL